jgi:CHRD domain
MGSSNLFGDFHPTEEGGDAMIQLRIAGLVAALTLVMMLGIPALAEADGTFKARLSGFQEVPAISTEASGEFEAKVSNDGASIEFELSYENLEGPLTGVVAHIHLGQVGVNGGVIVFLCGGGGRPACPTPGGTVMGTIEAINIIGPAGQGITAGELDEVIAAMRAGVTYVNVHTPPPIPGDPGFPGGEIRGRIRRGH